MLQDIVEYIRKDVAEKDALILDSMLCLLTPNMPSAEPVEDLRLSRFGSAEYTFKRVGDVVTFKLSDPRIEHDYEVPEFNVLGGDFGTLLDEYIIEYVASLSLPSVEYIQQWIRSTQ